MESATHARTREEPGNRFVAYDDTRGHWRVAEALAGGTHRVCEVFHDCVGREEDRARSIAAALNAADLRTAAILAGDQVALTIDVLERFSRGAGPLTPADARRAAQVVAQARDGVGRGEVDSSSGRALLTEAAGVFRAYEAHHRAEATKLTRSGQVNDAIDRDRKAETNAAIAGKIEAHLAVADPELQRLGRVWRGESRPQAYELDDLNRVHGLALSLVQDLGALITESTGVAGLHKNGDLADWPELLGGDWLGSFGRLRDYLDALGEPAPSATRSFAAFFELADRTVLTVNSPRGQPETVEVNGKRYVPEVAWTDHPVDVLKNLSGRMGFGLDPEREASMRAICDELVSVGTVRVTEPLCQRPHEEGVEPGSLTINGRPIEEFARKPVVEGLECTHQPGHRPDCECELCFPLVDHHAKEA